MFYSRAKQTFFTPRAEYELDIPSDILGPFHSSPHNPALQSRAASSPALWHSQSAHPDPAVFTEVAIEARAMLNASLQRFVRAASTNVGSQRAACGIAGGCFFILVTGFLPLTVTTGRWNEGPHGRLIRLTAFPGLWLGLTILIASLQGICLMIYVFGDLRQLRKFELARPTISRPMPTSISAPVLPRTPMLQVPTVAITRKIHSEKEEDIVATSPVTVKSVPSIPPNCRPFSPSSARSSATSCESCESEADPAEDIQEIEVSAAVFDEEPAPEGPATATCLHRPEYRPPPPPSSITFPSAVHHSPRARSAISAPNIRAEIHPGSRYNDSTSSMDTIYGPTAGFISTRCSDADTEERTGSWRSLPRRGRSTSQNFDFDLLPRAQRNVSARGTSGRFTSDVVMHPGLPPTNQHPAPSEQGAQHLILSQPSTNPTLTSMMGRAQYKCNKRPSITPASPNSTALVSSPIHPGELSPVSSIPVPERKERRRFSFALLAPSFNAGVPAFAAPLTQIRSPVVKRAQWEVVVRSAMVAFVITSAIIGVDIGVVP
ncbi:hypothetical protein ID866_1086 [Astraeus odoratus]|nr:hypothetical protein ID866_1086 [Astraeus odoratus]